MKCWVFLSLLSVCLAKVDYSGHKVYRAHPNEQQLHVIKDAGQFFQLDFWSDFRFAGDFVDFRVPPNLQLRMNMLLTRNRIPYEIFIEDLGKAILEQTRPRPQQMNLDDFDIGVYHTYEEIDNWIVDFTTAYAHLATAVKVGTGLSHENRKITAIKISTGSGNPAFVINCGIHAREWVTPATCIYTANQLIADYNVDDRVTALMNSIDFYIIPSANPDGYDYTWTQDRMWRKTRTTSSENGCTTACDGVDPNRNFDIHWNNPTTGASDVCCQDTYRGPSPFSEIETRNQRDFVNSISDVRGYIDVHSYSQMWMFPYGWTTSLPVDYPSLLKIGQDSVKAIESVHSKSYVTGTIANTIYVATGSTADYFYSTGIKCSFAAELRDKGFYGFTLPEREIIPTGEETYAGLLVIADNIQNGIC